MGISVSWSLSREPKVVIWMGSVSGLPPEPVTLVITPISKVQLSASQSCSTSCFWISVVPSGRSFTTAMALSRMASSSAP